MVGEINSGACSADSADSRSGSPTELKLEQTREDQTVDEDGKYSAGVTSTPSETSLAEKVQGPNEHKQYEPSPSRIEEKRSAFGVSETELENTSNAQHDDISTDKATAKSGSSDVKGDNVVEVENSSSSNNAARHATRQKKYRIRRVSSSIDSSSDESLPSYYTKEERGERKRHRSKRRSSSRDRKPRDSRSRRRESGRNGGRSRSRRRSGDGRNSRDRRAVFTKEKQAREQNYRRQQQEKQRQVLWNF